MVRQGIAPGVNVIATLIVVAASIVIFGAWYLAGEDVFV
jgi:ABC-type spermidine/putrescine transport system permease subunit II